MEITSPRDGDVDTLWPRLRKRQLRSVSGLIHHVQRHDRDYVIRGTGEPAEKNGTYGAFSNKWHACHGSCT